MRVLIVIYSHLAIYTCIRINFRYCGWFYLWLVSTKASLPVHLGVYKDWRSGLDVQSASWLYSWSAAPAWVISIMWVVGVNGNLIDCNDQGCPACCYSGFLIIWTPIICIRTFGHWLTSLCFRHQREKDVAVTGILLQEKAKLLYKWLSRTLQRFFYAVWDLDHNLQRPR